MSLLQGPRAASDSKWVKLDCHHHLGVFCTKCHKQLLQLCVNHMCCHKVFVLLQALEMLVDFGKPAPGQSQQHLWYNNPELAMSASSAGSYLIDLLHMRVLHLSPLAISAPEAFLEACTGVPPFCPFVNCQDPDTKLLSMTLKHRIFCPLLSCSGCNHDATTKYSTATREAAELTVAVIQNSPRHTICMLRIWRHWLYA